ncbi:MAG: SoxR reducing system RseC family protein [Ginsengibacter sp.]|jgi:hypothetical protein
MQQFEIEIKNEKKNSYRLYNWFALVIGLAGFSFLLFYNDWFVEAFGAIILVCVYLLIRLYRRKKHKAVFLFDDNGYLFFILGVGWLGLQNYLLTGLCLVLGIVYQMAMQKIIFLFKKEGILKTNFPNREIEWNTLENVVLKDTILTIDFKNNRIIQGEISSSKEIDEESFNRFVHSQISDHSGSTV